MPEFLQSAYNVVNQFLAAPIFLGDGKTLKDVLQNQRRRRRRVRVEAEDSGLSDADDGATFEPEEREARERKKAERQKRREAKDAQKKQKKRKEEAIYKSAEMIVDSDDAAGMNDDAAFWEREARLRARTAVADGSGGGQPLMKATGTRKRKKPAEPGKGRKKKRGATTTPPAEDEEAASDAPGADDDNLFGSPAASRAASEVPTTPPSDAEDDDAPGASDATGEA
jgi:replication fork protection complex subunit Tof1/Swi1